MAQRGFFPWRSITLQDKWRNKHSDPAECMQHHTVQLRSAYLKGQQGLVSEFSRQNIPIALMCSMKWRIPSNLCNHAWLSISN